MNPPSDLPDRRSAAEPARRDAREPPDDVLPPATGEEDPGAALDVALPPDPPAEAVARRADSTQAGAAGPPPGPGH